MTKHMSVAAMMMDQPGEERQRKFAETLAGEDFNVGKFIHEYGFTVSPVTLTTARKTLQDEQDPYEALKEMYVPGKRKQLWGVSEATRGRSAEQVLSNLSGDEKGLLLSQSSAEALQKDIKVSRETIVKMRKLRWEEMHKRVERGDESYGEAKSKVVYELNFMPYRKAFARLNFALDQRTPLSAARVALNTPLLSAEDLACMRIEAKVVKPPYLVGRGDFCRYLSELPRHSILDIIDAAIEGETKDLVRVMITNVSYGTIQGWSRMIRKGTPESTVFILHLGVLGNDAYDDDVDED